MQFYLDGYAPGDPDILAAAPGAENRPITITAGLFQRNRPIAQLR